MTSCYNKQIYFILCVRLHTTRINLKLNHKQKSDLKNRQSHNRINGMNIIINKEHEIKHDNNAVSSCYLKTLKNKTFNQTLHRGNFFNI